MAQTHSSQGYIEAINTPPPDLSQLIFYHYDGKISAQALDDAAVDRNRAGYDEAESAGAATASVASTHVDLFGCVGMRLLRVCPHG